MSQQWYKTNLIVKTLAMEDPTQIPQQLLEQSIFMNEMTNTFSFRLLYWHFGHHFEVDVKGCMWT